MAETDFSFQLPNQPPPDPAYLRFVEGLKTQAADPNATQWWRWHPGDGKWYVYSPAAWIMEDARFPDTPGGYALEDAFDIALTGLRWKLKEFYLPDLFRRLTQAYGNLRRQFPTSTPVWTPRGGGDWRNAIRRPPEGPVPDTGSKTGLSPACLAEIEKIRAYAREGYVSMATAQRLIDRVVENCPRK